MTGGKMPSGEREATRDNAGEQHGYHGFQKIGC